MSGWRQQRSFRHERLVVPGCQQLHGYRIKAHRGFAIEPLSIIGDNAIGKVAICFQQREARFHAGPIYRDILRLEENQERCSDPRGSNL